MKRNFFMAAIVFLVAILVLLAAAAWYLHASIYWSLGKARVYSPADMVGEYAVGDGASAKHLVYVPLGDSLTAGVGVDSYLQSYPYLLAQKIAEDSVLVTLKPFAVPGVRSRYVLDNFVEPAIASNPDIVTLFIGINDIHGNVPLDEFRKNYAEILSRLTEETHARVYVINLPYIGTSHLISFPYRWFFEWRTKQYNAVIEDLAGKYNATYIDLYSAHEPHALQNDYYASDFFHPNMIGYSLWAETIYAYFTN